MKLKLYHQAGGQLESKFESADLHLGGVPLFKWQTCLRSLLLVPGDYQHEVESRASEGSGEWLEDEFAYRRLLEIACGLHSPLVGETEVFGQFKDAVQARVASSNEKRHDQDAFETAFVATLQQWSKALIEDVKLIRQKHLQDLGSQSYGSLVRREVRELSPANIEFLGAGQLACEILPWLMKVLKADGAPEVTVHARNIEKARARLLAVSPNAGETTATVKFCGLENGPEIRPASQTRVLIIAAPLTALAIAAWIRDRAHFDLIIDLRGESLSDSLETFHLSSRLRSLHEIFSMIESSREIALVKKTAALGLVEQCVEVRGATTTHRPFGWEDVC